MEEPKRSCVQEGAWPAAIRAAIELGRELEQAEEKRAKRVRRRKAPEGIGTNARARERDPVSKTDFGAF